MAETERLLITSPSVRECARTVVRLSKFSLSQAADRGALPALRAAGRGVRIYRLLAVRGRAR